MMIVAALLLVVPPLLRSRVADRDAPGNANIALYRERLAELDQMRGRGEVEADRYAALREDLERGLLTDVDAPPPAPVAARPPPRWMAGAVAIVVPVCGLSVYLWLGSPHGLDPDAQSRGAAGIELAPDVEAPDVEAPDVEAMVASLGAKLANEPANADGWLLLARSQTMLGRFEAAAAAFERAHTLLGDSPSLLAHWAEAEAGLAGNRFPASALDRLDRALEIDPDHEKALWLGGFAAVQHGRPDTAIARWERLLAQHPPGSQEASLVSELLARIRGAADAADAADARMRRPPTGPIRGNPPIQPARRGSSLKSASHPVSRSISAVRSRYLSLPVHRPAPALRSP